MTAESAEDSWTSNPLSVLRHTINCLEGSSCQVPGCQDMKSSMGHSQNCSNSNCPALPCIAMRQFSTEHQVPPPSSAVPPSPQLSLEQIFRCALAATDLKPTLKRSRSRTAGHSSEECSSRSSTTSNSSSDDSLFRVPRGKPRRF